MSPRAMLVLAVILVVSCTMGAVFSEVPASRHEAVAWAVVIGILFAALYAWEWAGRTP